MTFKFPHLHGYTFSGFSISLNKFSGLFNLVFSWGSWKDLSWREDKKGRSTRRGLIGQVWLSFHLGLLAGYAPALGALSHQFPWLLSSPCG